MSSRVNLMAPEVRANPYPVYAELRRNAPVCQVDPGGRWVVSRYDDVLAVLKNPQIFSSTGIGRSSQPAWLGRNNPLADSMLVMDPPKHGRLRTLVSRAFGNQSVSRLEPRIRAIAEQLAAELPTGQSVDFVQAFALPLPSRILTDMLGLDVSLYPHFKRWSDDIVGTGAVTADDHVRHAQVRTTVDEMDRYLGAVLQDRRRQPTDDLVSDLVRAQVDGESLGDREILGFLCLLLVAGLETTVHLLSNSISILMEHPDVLRRLKADRSLIPQFVEEVLRYDSPAHGAARMTTAEVEVAGVKLPAQTPVVVLLASACRDERYFPEPDRFDLDRKVTNHITSFGYGPHFCLGAHLARLEGKLALEALLPRIAGLSRGEGTVEWNTSMIVRGPTRLPVRVHPA
jgi:cytochrome P450